MTADTPTNPDVLLVPTDDPGAAEAEYGPKGWIVSDLYAKPFHREYCGEKQWAVRFFRTAQPRQPELL